MTPGRVTVCGLGPGGVDRVTEQTATVLAGAEFGFLRTSRHPSASLAAGFEPFDELYERAERFDEVYHAIVERLVIEAGRRGHVVYAVPGSPLVLERSVRELRRRDDVVVEVLPAVSFLDEVWSRLDVDPVDDGVRLVDGHRFAVEAAGERGPLLVAHAHAQWVLSDIKLALDAGPEQRAVICQRLGTPDEQVVEVGWPDLDRTVEADHLTSVYIPELVEPVGRRLAAAVEMMDRLRTDCPWDRTQDHASLRPFLVEEAAETVDALDALVAALETLPGESGLEPDPAVGSDIDDAYWELEAELGDLLFQILFHSRLAAEAGRFDLGDVAATLVDKMRHRHPHVYGGSDYEPERWEEFKAAEKAGDGSVNRPGPLDGIPRSLSTLARAGKVLGRLNKAGIVVEPDDRWRPLIAAIESANEEERSVALGSLILSAVETGRRHGLDTDAAAAHALRRLERHYGVDVEAGGSPGSWVLG